MSNQPGNSACCPALIRVVIDACSNVMDTQAIPPKFMRPRVFARRVGVNWRTAYRYIEEGLWPAYKFQGVLLVDVDEVDAIIKGLTRRVPIKKTRSTKSPRRAAPSQPPPEVAAK